MIATSLLILIGGFTYFYMNENYMNHQKYIGKVTLIGMTFVDEKGELIEQYQSHGTIKSIDENNLMTVSRNGLPDFIHPLEEDSMRKATPGTYRERATGSVIEDPDFLTSWTVTSLSEENREFQKLHGFSGFENRDGK